MTLEELDVPSVGGRCHCDHEVVNVGVDQSFRDGGVEGGDVDHEQEGRDRRVLGCTYGDRREHLWGALKEETTLALG